MFREFLTCLGAIGEPRQAGTIEHKLIDVPVITVCAVLAHAETLEDIVPYNHQRTHQGKMCCGRTPFQTMIEGREIWKEKFVN